jgi:hypothetical protein
MLEYQILVDFVMTNTDRHLNNLGVLRDPVTLKLQKPAPIFDSGNSLFYKSNYIPVDKGLLNIPVTSWKYKEIELLGYVKEPKILDVNLLPSGDELYNLLCIDPAGNEETNKRVVKAYLKKIEYLKELQSGTKIYGYNYLKKQGVDLKSNRT